MDQSIVETIILVDSNTPQRTAVAQYLRECGYRVLEATSADEARQAIAHHKVDIVVTDISLKDDSGFAVSSFVRKEQPEVKIILTHTVEKTAAVAGDLCEDGPLDHPYHPQLLVERIKRLGQKSD
ncbi:response regulator [Rhizobium leguminosarum]|uniref:response regulator n=1 Tax=Rhizobium leguminosarum TaxID=384 RepID=UPI001C915D4A|nr:response regulator [Rhizobium leguminosarum]MBY3179506.1 response regulator [Rhizobium leguminosarum]